MLYDFLIEREKSLLESHIRKNKAALEAMLHHDFFEFGSSGTIWSRSATLASLSAEDGTHYVASNFSVHPISEDAVLITYSTISNGQQALRSSIWRKSGTDWQLFFHQGTTIL